MATRRKKFTWAAGIFVVVALGATVSILVARDPLLLPGAHEVEVYGLDDQISGETDQAPGVVGKAIGMCDADTYYAEDGDRRLCLVLNGPLGTVRATRKDGQVTVDGADAARLKAMAVKEDGTTTLVLMGGKPAALIPVATLTDGRSVSVRALT
jgi:hypothetical protein